MKNNTKRHTTPQSLNAAIKNICDNYASFQLHRRAGVFFSFIQNGFFPISRGLKEQPNDTYIDLTIKESGKAKSKVVVKRILRKYGYPPDMQMVTTETVLKQAHLITEELTHSK